MKQFRKIKPCFFSFHTQVYPFILRFSVNQTLEEICAEDDIDDTDDWTVSLLQMCTTPGRWIKFEDNVYVCVIRGFDYSPHSISVVAHEIHHIVNAIFKNIGVKPDFENDECSAYLTDYITEKFFEGLNDSQHTPPQANVKTIDDILNNEENGSIEN